MTNRNTPDDIPCKRGYTAAIDCGGTGRRTGLNSQGGKYFELLETLYEVPLSLIPSLPYRLKQHKGIRCLRVIDHFRYFPPFLHCYGHHMDTTKWKGILRFAVAYLTGQTSHLGVNAFPRLATLLFPNLPVREYTTYSTGTLSFSSSNQFTTIVIFGCSSRRCRWLHH
jgi:hypothetical protein